MRPCLARIVAVVLLGALAAAPPPGAAGTGPSPAADEPAVRDLAGPRWVLRQVGEEALAPSEGGREAFLVFDAKLMRFSGSGGCNRLAGSYRTEAADGLTLGPITATRMACLNIDDEADFLRALGNTRRYRISGRHLELLDESDKPVARLEDTSGR